jgi:hypothetical protein
MKQLATIGLLLSIAACTSKPTSEAIDDTDSVSLSIVEPTDSVDYLQLGFDVMRDESFGGIKIGLSPDEVVKLLGEAESKSEITASEADGMNWQTWFYPAKGCEVSFYQNEDQSWSSASYLLKETSTFKSTRGIGIGSTAQEVKKAYQKEIGRDEGPEQIIVGTVYGGIVFWMTDGKVRNIFVGASAE